MLNSSTARSLFTLHSNCQLELELELELPRSHRLCRGKWPPHFNLNKQPLSGALRPTRRKINHQSQRPP